MRRPNSTSSRDASKQHALPTWNWLVSREPRLHSMACDIMASTPPDEMPEFWRVWASRKQQLDALVGWECRHHDRAMRTHEARDVAYDHLWRLYCDTADARSCLEDSR